MADVTLTDEEREALAAAILGRTNINALPKTERAVERYPKRQPYVTSTT